VSDVARAAGVADGTIYLYFANKNELLGAIFENAMERFHRAGDGFVLAVDDPVEQLRRLVETQLRLVGQNRQLAAVFQIDLRHSAHFLGELSRTALAPHFEFTAGIIQRGQDRGAFSRELEPMQAATMIFGVLDQLATQWVLSRRNYRLETQAPAAAGFVLRALGVTT
jgi:TetR/AcrR family fatty acid metabolism transcriptional regulator